MYEAAQFFNGLWNLPIKKKCLENPVMVGHAIRLLTAGKQTQSVQPYEFGIMETKRLCLWLDNLDKLIPTNDVKTKTMALPYSERAKVHYAAPGHNRWKERSRSYEPIMAAMAEQWA